MVLERKLMSIIQAMPLTTTGRPKREILQERLGTVYNGLFALLKQQYQVADEERVFAFLRTHSQLIIYWWLRNGSRRPPLAVIHTPSTVPLSVGRTTRLFMPLLPWHKVWAWKILALPVIIIGCANFSSGGDEVGNS